MDIIIPNRRLYILLLCSAIIVTVIAVFVPTSNPWFTIITGIGCGGIASVIVAWLIDEVNCSNQSKKSKDVHILLWTALSLFAYSYANMYKALHKGDETCKKEKHTWIEWRKRLIDDIKNDGILESSFDDFKHVFDVAAKDVIEQCQYFQDNRSQLISDGLMSSHEFFFIHTIQQEMELCITVLEHDTSSFWKFLDSLSNSFETYFKQTSNLSYLNSIVFWDLVEFVEESERKEKEMR